MRLHLTKGSQSLESDCRLIGRILYGMNSEEETIKSERTRAEALAFSLVEEAWNLGANPMTLTVPYEGAIWQVSVKVDRTEG